MESTTTQPQQVALVWRALANSGDYAKNWEQAAAHFFCANITEADCEKKRHEARAPLGKVISR